MESKPLEDSSGQTTESRVNGQMGSSDTSVSTPVGQLEEQTPPSQPADADDKPNQAHSVEEDAEDEYIPPAHDTGSLHDGDSATPTQRRRSRKPRVTCDACGKTFGRRADLNRHVRHVHKGVRNFRCPICFHEFAERGHFTSHVSAVHSRTQFMTGGADGPPKRLLSNLATACRISRDGNWATSIEEVASALVKIVSGSNFASICATLRANSPNMLRAFPSDVMQAAAAAAKRKPRGAVFSTAMRPKFGHSPSPASLLPSSAAQACLPIVPAPAVPGLTPVLSKGTLYGTGTSPNSHASSTKHNATPLVDSSSSLRHVPAFSAPLYAAIPQAAAPAPIPAAVQPRAAPPPSPMPQGAPAGLRYAPYEQPPPFHLVQTSTGPVIVSASVQAPTFQTMVLASGHLVTLPVYPQSYFPEAMNGYSSGMPMHMSPQQPMPMHMPPQQSMPMHMPPQQSMPMHMPPQQSMPMHMPPQQPTPMHMPKPAAPPASAAPAMPPPASQGYQAFAAQKDDGRTMPGAAPGGSLDILAASASSFHVTAAYNPSVPASAALQPPPAAAGRGIALPAVLPPTSTHPPPPLALAPAPASMPPAF